MYIGLPYAQRVTATPWPGAKITIFRGLDLAKGIFMLKLGLDLAQSGH